SRGERNGCRLEDCAMNDLTPIEMDELERLHREQAPPRRGWGRLGWAVLVAAGVALVWYLLSGSSAPAAAPPQPVVTVASPLRREIPDWHAYIGRLEASHGVGLRPRGAGETTAVHFQDGQFVGKGQPLFTIDPRP